MLKLLFTLVLTLLMPFKAYSDEAGILEKWSAPIYGETSQKTLYGGAALATLLYVNRTKIGDPLQEEWGENEPMGDLAKFGDYMGQLVPNVAYLAITHWNREEGENRRRRNLMFDTTFYAGMTTMLLKHLVGEERPHGGDNLSFPSGHTATAFSFAAVVGIEHEWYWAVPAYAMAAVVGASRINDNAHYLHDVVFGATLGISYAYGLSALRDGPGNFGFMPYQDGGMFSYNLKFN